VEKITINLIMIKTYTQRHGTYTSDKFLNYIDKTKVKTIVEGGSRYLKMPYIYSITKKKFLYLTYMFILNN